MLELRPGQADEVPNGSSHRNELPRDALRLAGHTCVRPRRLRGQPRRRADRDERDAKAPSVTLFVSQDDRALSLSRLIAGNAARLGAIDPEAEPYRSLLERAHVKVVDLTKLAAEDPANHSKFATGDVVRAIGLRLAAGQTLTDTRTSLGETIGGIAIGGANVIGRTTATIAAAPFGGVGDTSPAPVPATEDARPLTP